MGFFLLINQISSRLFKFKPYALLLNFALSITLNECSNKYLNDRSGLIYIVSTPAENSHKLLREGIHLESDLIGIER